MQNDAPRTGRINSPITIAILTAIVAVACVIIGFFLNRGEPMMIVSYTVFPAEMYSTSVGRGGKTSTASTRSTASTVNTILAPTLVLHRTRVWNSSYTTNSFTLIVDIEEGNPATPLLWVGHKRKPGLTGTKNPSSATFPAEIEYEYLNPHDRDDLLLLTNESIVISVYPEGKGVKPNEVLVFSWSKIWNVVGLVVSIVVMGVAAFAIILAFGALAGKRPISESS